MIRRLKGIFIGVAVTLVIVLMYSYYSNRNSEQERLTAQTALIEKQVRNVSKLVVTEATYAKVYTYENTKSYGWDFYSSQKRALIISNAKVQIAYDLRKMNFQIEENEKTIRILNIPPPEIKIDPDLTYYNIDNGLTNRFEAKDFNKMKSQITKDLRGKISKSEIVNNAQNRLLSELSQVYVLTESFGWKLEYDGSTIDSSSDWTSIMD
ncbi:Protein of unknown function [Nonlabens sp. Hel1_33_55]|uniref:DUF4230 domain-containing protein n=1 Tax=Nonlabens sp. Hel1_33_55 TaxID=1336802 RepID=UPI000875C171|nr:DUF4230 domain-containing protein [Nonlabens sp. Hel1_33_55]SCY16961.1 Protein of unknown function [Nonlabens sp. Hel1_33_55]